MKKDKKRTGEGLILVTMKNDDSFVKLDDFSVEELQNCLSELIPSIDVDLR